MEMNSETPKEERKRNEDSRLAGMNPSHLDEEKKFFVANMAFSLTPEQVKAWFTTFGPVQFVKIIYDKMGKSKGYGFVYMLTSEGAQAVEEFATESGYRVEMYGRKNVQLHKHMTDRPKHFPQLSTSSIRRSFSSSRNDYDATNQPMERSKSATFSKLSPTKNTLSSDSPNQKVFYDPNIYPMHMVSQPQIQYASSAQIPDANTSDAHRLYPSSRELDRSLNSLSYYYNPVVGPTSPYFFPNGTMYPSSDVGFNAGAYTVPMYTVINAPSYNEYTPSYPTPSLKPSESCLKNDSESTTDTKTSNDEVQGKTDWI